MISNKIESIIPIQNSNTSYKRSKFTAQEDRQLLILVEIYKFNWKKISIEMKNRSVRQCKERYYHYLSPNINKNDWSHEEDVLLLSSVEKYGKKWKALESLFNNRTEVDIRNRFNILSRKIFKIIKEKNFAFDQKIGSYLKNQNIIMNYNILNQKLFF